MTHATPRPWTYQLDPSYTTHGGWKCEVSTTLGEKIASVFASSKGEAKERAALIVRAVNTLDEAKAALHAAYEELNQKETTPQDRAEVLQMVRQVLEKMA